MRLYVLAMTAVLAAPAAEIPQGAHVLLRLLNSIDTRTAREGDYVYMRTATPIVVSGRTLVPEGTYVQGVVSRVKRSGRVSGRAELGLHIDTLTLSSGQVIQVSPHLSSTDSQGTGQQVRAKENDIQAGGTKGADAARVATVAGTGAAIGGMADRSWSGAGIGGGIGGGVGLASVLLSRGREVQLRQGSSIDVVFDRPVPVD